jgi:hypothetical protein
VVAAGLALQPALAADRRVWIVAVAGVAGVAMLICALALRRPTLLAWSLAVLGGEYAVWLTERGGSVDTRSPLYAAGFVLVAELAYDSLGAGSVRAQPELHARRALHLVALATGAIVAGTVVLAAAAVPAGGGVALTAVGVAAATLTLLLVVRLGR